MHSSVDGFNEAAATSPRKLLVRCIVGAIDEVASMRPRRLRRGNIPEITQLPYLFFRFNEAAATSPRKQWFRTRDKDNTIRLQ